MQRLRESVTGGDGGDERAEDGREIESLGGWGGEGVMKGVANLPGSCCYPENNLSPLRARRTRLKRQK